MQLNDRGELGFTMPHHLAVLMVLSLMVAACLGSPTRTGPNQPEVLPPGALVWRGPNAGSATTASAGTNAPSATSQAPLKLSPGLAEVVRMQAAGVNDQVLLAHIQNSPPFRTITPDALIYLKDRGVSPHVLTALLQHQRPPYDAAMSQTAAYPDGHNWAAPAPGEEGPGLPGPR